MSEYYLLNKEKIKEKRKKYYLLNKEKEKQTMKKYKNKNKEKIKLYQKEYVNKNRKKVKLYQKEYVNKNREKINLYKRNWKKNKLRTDLNFKIKENLRHRVYLALKNNKKYSSIETFLDCTIESFWKYLEKQFMPGMTKQNYGEWHIDHIKPCKAFDLTKPEEQAKCFHYTNLQPLWAYDNLSKGAKY